jgi:hypothetical protein
MKKAILIPLLLINIYSFAQKGAIGFTLGPVVGINSGSIPEGPGVDSKAKDYGFSAGAFSRLKILSIYLQPEIFYHSHSLAFTGMENGNSYDQVIHLKKMQYNGIVALGLLGVSDIFKLRVLTGAAFVNNFKQDQQTNGDNFLSIRIRDKYKKGIAGISFDLLKFTTEFRYEFSLRNISNTNNSIIKDKMFVLSLGYKLF